MYSKGGPAVRWDLLPIVGICSFRLSAWSIFGSNYLGLTNEAFVYSRLAQFVSTLIIMAISLVTGLSRRRQRAVIVLSTLLMVIGALLCIGRAPSDPLFLTARAVHGAFSSVLLLGWGTRTCEVEPRRSCVWIACAFALYGISTFLLQEVPHVIAETVMVITPLVSGITLAICTREAPYAKIERAQFVKEVLTHLEWGPALLLLACSIVCSLTGIFISTGYTGITTYTSNVFRVVAFCFIALVFTIWTCLLRRDNPDQMWPLFSSVIFFGLLGYSSFSFVSPASSTSFMHATQDCLMLFAWVYISGVVFRRGLPRLVSFGVGTLLFMRTDLPATLLNHFLPPGSQPVGSAMTVALSFIMAAVLIVYTIVLLGRKYQIEESPAPRSGSTPMANNEDAEHNNGHIAQREIPRSSCSPSPSCDGVGSAEPPMPLQWLIPYGLTAREAQVVELLLRGYTLPGVGDHFGVSLNTARWYAKNIYRKLGIHRKAELITLAEQGGYGEKARVESR